MNPSMMRQISAIFECNFRNFESELQILERIKKYDEYTYLHCLNVSKLSVQLGQRLGLTGDHLVDLGWAALLHDVGKLHVPLEVLNKMKKFTPEELTIMQSHPVESLTAFAEAHPISLAALKRLSAAFEHHQRYDLKGYPIVYKKLTLHPFSRIVAIADTYDAMTTDRIYQRRVLPDVALKIMVQGFGTIFDPVVLQAFITAMGAYPVGSIVRLSDQEPAIVTKYHHSSPIDRPEVFAFKAEKPHMVDLKAIAPQELRILRSEFPEEHEVQPAELLEQARALQGDTA